MIKKTDLRNILAASAALFLLVPAASALADDDRIVSLAIHVLDMPTKEVLTEVSPGGTLTLDVGDAVVLRMTGTPASKHRGLRYPSARFEVVSGKDRVRVERANEEVGNIALRAVRPDNPRRPHERTVVEFEVTGDWPLSDKMRRGRIAIEVVGASPQVAPPQVAPPLRSGVILYDQTGFRGYAETLLQSDSQLSDNPIRDNAVSSIRIAPGCEAVLFDAPGFNGRRVRLDRDVEDLSSTTLGIRTASSIEVTCGRTGGGFGSERRGVTIYADEGFRGRQEKFYGDDYNLEDNPIRSDSATSIRVDSGCRVTLYQDAEYRGRSHVFYEDVANLGRTPVGNDSVTSLRVECDDRRR